MVKVLVAKLDNANSIPGTHKAKGEKHLCGLSFTSECIIAHSPALAVLETGWPLLLPPEYWDQRCVLQEEFGC